MDEEVEAGVQEIEGEGHGRDGDEVKQTFITGQYGWYQNIWQARTGTKNQDEWDRKHENRLDKQRKKRLDNKARETRRIA